MIKRNNKKGFTIVELVIVIAVIAILAAVLIPTFAGIIRKANISADTQLAKNLNSALAADEAIDGKPEDFTDVLAVFRENGYVVANLNPTAAGCYFVWESDSNQIILVDAKNDYEVIYASKDLANDKPCNTWYFAINDPDLVAEIEALNAESVPNVLYTPKTQEALLDSFVQLQDKDGAQVVVVTEDLDLKKGGEIFKITKSTANITVDLSGATVNCAGAVDTTVEFGKADRAFTVETGALTLVNGVVNAGDSYGTVKATNNAKVTVEDMELVNSLANGLNLKAIGADAVIDVADTTISAVLGGGCEAAGGTINLTNVTINQTGFKDHCSTAVAASGATGVANVNSGTYTSENVVLYVFSSGGTINVKSGTFVTTGNTLFTLTTQSGAKADSVIKLSGGTFTCGNETKTFDTLDAEWLAKVTEGESSIEKVGNDWVITLAAK